MSDVTAAPEGTTAARAIQLPGLGEIAAFLRRGDIGLAIGVLTILVVLIPNSAARAKIELKS